MKRFIERLELSNDPKNPNKVFLDDGSELCGLISVEIYDEIATIKTENCLFAMKPTKKNIIMSFLTEELK